MADPFLGEIRIFPFNFAPQGWASCNGQVLPISQNTALFSLLGTFYGGNGTSNFALPNLQDRAPLSMGQGTGLSLYNLGQTGGEQSLTLIQSQMPAHTHVITASSNPGDLSGPGNAVWAVPAAGRNLKAYNTAAGSSPTMNAGAFSAAGGNQPHDNMMPYLVFNFCIALQGIFPARN